MLYLRISKSEASPKAISGRTSYLRVRLEFHRYPQVIPELFNARGFGPPRNFTFASTEASPKAISGRTSYLRVRLEFHRYPQVIPELFNARGFGPPRNFTFAST